MDIAKAERQKLIWKLVGKYDVLIENYKVGGLKQYGLDYAAIKEQFSELIYCSVSGFGLTGPKLHL